MDGILPNHQSTRPPLGDATHRLNSCPAPKAKHIDQQDLLKTPDQMSIVTSPPSIKGNVETNHLSPVPCSPAESKRNLTVSAASIFLGISKRKTHIGPWQLGKTLGKGATCRVRLAKHAVTGQTAAIKIISKKAIAKSESVTAMDRTASLYKGSGVRQMPSGIEREVVIMKLIEHPNVVSLYDVWENRGELYLVLEHVEGGELYDYLSTHAPLPEEEAVRLFRQIIAALGYCHRFNICHRDLKPENILLDHCGNVKLADFGMAALQPAGHWLNTSCGSPHYAAPEIIYGQKYRGDKADIWSCGIILFALLTGYLPFDGGELQKTLRLVKRGEYKIPSKLSLEASDLIQCILQMRPDDRITIQGIWMHPLLRKYERLHQAMSHHHVGPAPPLTWQDCGPPIVNAQDMDVDILRNLQTLWHDVEPEDLLERLLSPEPTQERMFYNALVKFRNEQLENYQGQPLKYSSSDYHHISRFSVNKRRNVRVPSVSRRSGQISAISNIPQDSFIKAPNPSPPEEKDDPFRSPPHIAPGPGSGGQCAQVTVHQKCSEADQKDLPEPPVKLAEVLEEEPDEDNECFPSSPFSIVPNKKSKASITRSLPSRASRSSSRRGVNTTPTSRSASYKRNVVFYRTRTRSQGSLSAKVKRTRGNVPSINGQASEYSFKSDVDDGPFWDGRSSSPLLPDQPTVVRGVGITAKYNPKVKIVGKSDIIWKDEARKVSNELSQICEEAFNGSLSTRRTASTCMGSETPATPVSMASAGDSPSQISWSNSKLERFSHTPEGSPKSYTFREVAEPRRKLIQHSTQDGSEDAPSYLSGVMDHLDRLMEQDETQKCERREKGNENADPYYDPFVNTTRDTGYLPMISEELNNSFESENWSMDNHEASSHNSQSASSIRKRQSQDGKATIRMVTQSSQSEIRPLNIQKNRAVSDGACQTLARNMAKCDSCKGVRPATRCASAESRPTHFFSELDPIQEVPKSPKRTDTKAPDNRKWSWFRPKSQGSSEKAKVTADIKPIQPSSTTVTVHEAEPESNTRQGEPPQKTKASKNSSEKQKGGFFKRFMKKRQSKNTQNPSAGPDFTDTEPLLGRPTEIDHSSDTNKTEKPLPPKPHSTGRSQNWFARFFQIKPATRVLPLNTTKLKGRKDVLKILREWKQFGMEDVHLDKANGVIHGKVGEKNCLRLRAVEFSAEFYTVLEHGQQANLSVVRFKQERGAASSFHKVVDALETAMKQRGLLIEDPDRAKKMRQILDDFPNN